MTISKERICDHLTGAIDICYLTFILLSTVCYWLIIVVIIFVSSIIWQYILCMLYMTEFLHVDSLMYHFVLYEAK